MTNFLHLYDLPAEASFQGAIAIDTEALGLNNKRDRLCVVQMSDGRGDVHLVHFPHARYDAPNLKRILAQPGEKLFHFARFDVAIIQEYLGVLLTPVYCTRTASRLIRTYTDRHGLKDLCKEMLGVEISKQQQSSDWGALELSKDQIDYAASDVLYLHQLREKLDERLAREGRLELARATMDCLPARALLDLAGWADVDIFAHS
ncbi:MAG: ribonuclease D [Rickettsiales bacterium]|nr:ribonuclease D [Rickettsiales bacterium]